MKYLDDSTAKYTASNNDKNVFNGVPKINCIIVGLTSFMNKLSQENQEVCQQVAQHGASAV